MVLKEQKGKECGDNKERSNRKGITGKSKQENRGKKNSRYKAKRTETPGACR